MNNKGKRPGRAPRPHDSEFRDLSVPFGPIHGFSFLDRSIERASFGCYLVVNGTVDRQKKGLSWTCVLLWHTSFTARKTLPLVETQR